MIFVEGPLGGSENIFVIYELYLLYIFVDFYYVHLLYGDSKYYAIQTKIGKVHCPH